MRSDQPAAFLTPDERAQLVEWLDRSQETFLGAIGRSSATQWTWKPLPEQWSVAEAAEHVVLAEALMFGLAQAAVADPPNPNWETETAGKTDLIVRVLPSSGLGKARAPEPTWPTQQLTHAQVVERFVAERARIGRFLADTERPLKAHTRVHPFRFFGTLNAYQWLVYIPLHALRHAEQITAVQALWRDGADVSSRGHL